MKTITKRKFTLLVIGILVISASQITSQFVVLNDLIKGLFTGIGIGLLLTAVIVGDFKEGK